MVIYVYKMADQKKRRAVAAIDFKSLELAYTLQFGNKEKKEEKMDGHSKFYDVEAVSEPVVIDGILKRKVKYVGYGREHDEWLPASDIRSKTEGDRASFSPLVLSDLGRLKVRIKENLSLRRKTSTKVDIAEPISHETWCVLSACLTPLRLFKKRPTIYSCSHEKLSNLFKDPTWSRRVINEAGDVARVNMSTLQIVAYVKKPITDFLEEDGMLALSPISRGLYLKISFAIDHAKYFE